jgi:hypothetical protein
MEGVYKDLHMIKIKGTTLAKNLIYYGYIPLILYLGILLYIYKVSEQLIMKKYSTKPDNELNCLYANLK